MKVDRIVVSKEEELKKKKSWFSLGSSKRKTPPKSISRPPSVSSFSKEKSLSTKVDLSDNLPERMEIPATLSTPTLETPGPGPDDSTASLPVHAGFDFSAIQDMIQNDGGDIGMSIQSPTPTPGQLGVHSSTTSLLGPPPPYTRSVSVPLPPLPEKEQPEKQRTASVRRDLQEHFDLPSRTLSVSESDLPVSEARAQQEEDESGNNDDPFSSRASADGRRAVGRDAALVSPSVPSTERGGDRGAWWDPSNGGGDPFAGEDEDGGDNENEYADFVAGSSRNKPLGSSYPTFGNGFNHTDSHAGSASAVRSPAMESTISFGGSVWGKETNMSSSLGGSTLASTSTAGSIKNAIGSPSIGHNVGDFKVGSSRMSSDPGLATLSFGGTNLDPFAGSGSSALLSFGSSDGFPIGGEELEAGKRGDAGANAKTTDFWIPPPLVGQKKRSDTGNSATTALGSNPWG